ncbi:MAG TPA: AAA family ATPase [Tepidisphaeraceae bacterium]|nr:AAA family ATPase [Tepidisphaeraceae bacterium]
MPKWIQASRVRAAINNLNLWRNAAHTQNAVHIWPLLAMIEAGASANAPIEFREAAIDRPFWDRYGRLPGDTRDRSDPQGAEGKYTRDFYVDPVVLQKKSSNYWHQNPGTLRKRFINTWRAATLVADSLVLANDYANIFVTKVLTKGGAATRVPVVDLAVWLFRNEEFSDNATARTLEQRFLRTFRFTPADYEKIFEFQEEGASHIFTTAKPSDEEYLRAIEESLVTTGAVIPPAPPEQAETAGEDVTSELKDDDWVLTEVKKLIDIGTSGIILRGCPGTSKTWYAKQIARHLAKKSSHIYKVQFHPSYGYEDFVEGYQPNERAKSGFEIIDKVFLKACETASKLKGKTPVFFIIDEINRGDPARIFGELLTYIEHGYRGEKFSKAYTGKLASVPANLVILGTMNQHDRSITQLDVALVRRFDHIDINPSSSILQDFLEKSQALTSDQIDRIVKWFEALQNLLPFGIGHTYLKDVKNPEQLQTLWQYRMLPYCKSVLELEPERLEDVKKSFDGMYKAVVGQQPAED